jgi:Flp pilus assembly pilin Flp
MRAMREEAFRMRFKAAAREFASDCSAAAVVEYALLVIFVAIAIVAALGEISGYFNGIYGLLAAAITG